MHIFGDMMKKIDDLLKQAESFEKLAIYGERKAFLSAIAQTALPSEVMAQVKTLADNLNALGESSISAQLDKAVSSHSLDLNSLTNLVHSAMVAMHKLVGPENPKYLQSYNTETALKQLQSGTSSEVHPYGQEDTVTFSPPDQIVGKRPGTGMGSIDPYVQLALDKLGYSVGASGADGSLGPATRAAINKFKEAYRMPTATDSQVFEVVKSEYQRKFPGMQFATNHPGYNPNEAEPGASIQERQEKGEILNTIPDSKIDRNFT